MRPKIDHSKMSSPNYDSHWHDFANRCYSHMDTLEEQAQMYGEFCVLCDREEMPLIKFEDYLKLDK